MHLSRTTLAQAALVAAIAGALYSFHLYASPPHLTHDEIKFALQAKAIADTGRDINGRAFPLYFKEPGFSVGRDPLCIYVTSAVLTVLPLSDSSIRLPTAIVGGVGVGLVFILARLMFANAAVAWIVAIILALSPTYYLHSRLALSVIYPVPFTIAWLICFHLYLKSRAPRYAYASGVVLGLGVYSYLAAALMMPLYLAASAIALIVQRDRRGVVRLVGSFAVMLLPIVVWQVVEPERYANILSAYRLYETQPTGGGGKLQELLSVSGVRSRVDTLWEAFNPTRLFFTGESSLQISTREVGSLLTPAAVFLLAGLGRIVFRPRSVMDWLLLFGLISAPLPAVLMADVEIRRWLVVLPFIAMIAGIGAEHLLQGSRRARVVVATLVVVMALQFAVFAVDFFGAYRLRSSVWFGGNIRAALERVLADARTQPPSRVYIASDIPWVEAYWRFYSKVHGQDSLLERTQYVHLAGEEIPRASHGAVIVTPAGDASLSARLLASGWELHNPIPDLDGHPSLAVWSAAAQ